MRAKLELRVPLSRQMAVHGDTREVRVRRAQAAMATRPFVDTTVNKAPPMWVLSLLLERRLPRFWD